MTLHEWRTQSDNGVQRALRHLEKARKELSLVCLDWPTEKEVRGDSYVAALKDPHGADIVARIAKDGICAANDAYASLREITEQALAVRRAVGRVHRYWNNADIEDVRREPHFWGLDTEILEDIDKGGA
jgi:hypothetical protein